MPHPQYAKRNLQNKKTVCKNKKILKAPLGFFLFADKIKKGGRTAPNTAFSRNFSQTKKSILGSLQKNSVETSWSPLTPEHGFPSLFISARPKALPSAFPFRAVPFGCCQNFIDILLFSSFSFAPPHFRHCMSPLITQIPAAPVFLTDAAFRCRCRRWHKQEWLRFPQPPAKTPALWGQVPSCNPSRKRVLL